MNDSVRQSLCEAVDGSILMGHMQEFARWVKLSGTPDELHSLRLCSGRLDEFGYRTELSCTTPISACRAGRGSMWTTRR